MRDVEAGYNTGDGTVKQPSDHRQPVKLMDEFDVFVGTSTGAIIAAGLAQGMTAQQLLALYTGDDRKKIFSRRLAGRVSRVSGWVSETFFTTRYYPDGLAEVIHSKLHMMMTKSKKPLFITATELKSEGGYEFVMFDSIQAQRKPQQYDVNLCNALRSSTAAPTFFPEYIVPCSAGSQWRGRRLVDGGVMCNSPAWQAVLTLCADFSDIPDILTRIQVLSLGTGSMKSDEEHDHWSGQLSWAKPAINAMFSAQAAQTDRTLKTLLKNGYLRWNYGQYSSVSDFVDLDDIRDSTIRDLRTIHNVDGYYKIDELRKFLGLN